MGERIIQLPPGWPAGWPISRTVQLYRDIRAHNTDPVFHQEHFQFGLDDGTDESDYTLVGAEDTPLLLLQGGLGNITRVCRISIDQEETQNDQNNTVSPIWRFNINAGGWTDLTTSSTGVRIVNASSFADNADTTLRLTASYTHNGDTGTTTEDGSHSTTTWDTKAQRTVEYVTAIEFIDADLNVGDNIRFAIWIDGAAVDVTVVNAEVDWTTGVWHRRHPDHLNYMRF